MATDRIGWCYIDGAKVLDKDKRYVGLTKIKNNIIYYGDLGIRIYNDKSLVNGAVYRIYYLGQDLPHKNDFTTISGIDTNYDTLLSDINTLDLTIDTNNGPDKLADQEFVVTGSCIIFYASSEKHEYDRNNYALILVDPLLTPRVIGITAKYTGPQIPIGDQFKEEDLEVRGIYEDGNTVLIRHGSYSFEPSDRRVTVVGSNVISVTYEKDGVIHPAGTVVMGVKKIVDVEARYDTNAPHVAIGREAERKYFTVLLVYSDGTKSATSDYLFPKGLVVNETNHGDIEIYCKGFTRYANVPTYDVSTSRLIAYYTGGNVEVGTNWIKDNDHVKIKIYYADSTGFNSHYEDIDVEDCEFSQPNIDHEGINQIMVQYEGRLGVITTYMAVVGIKPEVVLNFIDAEYTGPDIVVGHSFSSERVIVKAHYSNGDVIQVSLFNIDGNLVKHVGINEFLVTYNDREGGTASTPLTVMGIAADSTTEDGYNPVSLDNNYPEATKYNNRYRGPAESFKHDRLSKNLYDNIYKLYRIFYSIEKDFNDIINSMSDSSAMKYTSLNVAEEISVTTRQCINDERFVTGHYQPLESNNE